MAQTISLEKFGFGTLPSPGGCLGADPRLQVLIVQQAASTRKDNIMCLPARSVSGRAAVLAECFHGIMKTGEKGLGRGSAAGRRKRQFNRRVDRSAIFVTYGRTNKYIPVKNIKASAATAKRPIQLVYLC